MAFTGATRVVFEKMADYSARFHWENRQNIENGPEKPRNRVQAQEWVLSIRAKAQYSGESPVFGRKPSIRMKPQNLGENLVFG